MMRAFVVSDSHGSVSSLSEAYAAALKECGAADCIIHLGDFARDAVSLAQECGVPLYSVAGNCDAKGELETERIITLEGARLLLTHGHRYGVALSAFALALRAEEKGCAIALYGHTHVSLLSAHGPLLLLNPGSTSQPRGGRKRSFAMLEIDKGSVLPRIITF